MPGRCVAEAIVLRSVPGGVTGGCVSGFEVGYVTEDGVEHRVELADAWAARFESCRPARRFPQYKGQKHFPGFPGGSRSCG